MAKKVFIRTPYNYDRDLASRESGIDFSDSPSLAVQSEKDNCDINIILERFNVTGQMPANVRVPEYADFEDVYDFHSAMNVVREAQESFGQLPAKLRARFGNDPQQYLEFCTNPENVEEMVKLGLAVKREDVIMESPADVPRKGEKHESGDSSSGVARGEASSRKPGESGSGRRGVVEDGA